jgi:predicted phosphate transport protein (TIGR00153 family)
MGKLSLFRQETKFFAYFQQETENIVKMAKQLKDMVYIWQNIKERASILADLEQQGDAITHDIMTLLHRSFITPLDREDITALAHSLDHIADRIHSVADTVFLYSVESPTDRSRELSDLILQAVSEVAGGVSEVSSSRIRHPEDILKRCVTINQIENAGDVVYRAALAELFAQPNDMAFVVKWREIYKNMKSAISGCEACADVLEGIAAKYA